MTWEFDSNNRNVKSLIEYLKSLDYVKVETESEYDPEFVRMVKNSQHEAKEGKVSTVKTEDLWKRSGQTAIMSMISRLVDSIEINPVKGIGEIELK